jgi:dienelactone hydrolase
VPRQNAAEAKDYVGAPFASDGISHDVYRKGDGPSVLVLHELPGVDRRTIAVAERVREAGFRVVVPVMVGPAHDDSSPLDMLANLGRICVSREVVALGRRRTSPIVGWLLALARSEAQAGGHDRVGVVGMCLTGGFAIGMAVDPLIGVAVASQPGLPIAWSVFGLLPGQKCDLGVSDRDLVALRGRRDGGDLCIRCLRFERDRISPRERALRLREELGDAAVYDEIPNRAEHSVLSIGATENDPEATAALDRTLDLLKERLL